MYTHTNGLTVYVTQPPVTETDLRNKPKWISDMALSLPHKKIILATGYVHSQQLMANFWVHLSIYVLCRDCEMQFFEMVNFEPYCQLKKLESVPLKLVCWYVNTMHSGMYRLFKQMYLQFSQFLGIGMDGLLEQFVGIGMDIGIELLSCYTSVLWVCLYISKHCCTVMVMAHVNIASIRACFLCFFYNPCIYIPLNVTCITYICRHEPENELKSIILVGDKDVRSFKLQDFAQSILPSILSEHLGIGCCDGHGLRKYSRCIQVSN